MSYAARLHARPTHVTHAAPTGQHKLEITGERDSYFYVPPSYQPANPAPLALLLHGAGGHAHHGLGLLQHLADDNGVILVAPASTLQTWDVIAKRAYGRDIALLDESLVYIFERYAVDSSRLAIGGFSDGGSYALSVGLANGEIFTHVIAFSPGFIASVVPHGRPKVFISHGIKDNVLPVDFCSRKLVPQLQQANYSVKYQEFDGGHTIPTEIAQSAMEWFLDRR